MNKRLLVIALTFSIATLVAAPPAAANDFQCVGIVTLGSFDNVVVPEGATCDISNSEIRGNVKALRNSRLLVSGGNTIAGNVEGDNAQDVQIFNRGPLPNVIRGNSVFVMNSVLGSAVCGAVVPRGDIIIVKSRGTIAVGGGLCAPFGGGNSVELGNIKVEDTVITGLSFDVSDNKVGQNVQIFKNIGGQPKTVVNNVVGESVQCFDNAPPFVGGPNLAPKREGQCF